MSTPIHLSKNFLCLLLTVLAVGCDDHLIINSLPSSHIKKSEELDIPAGIAVPTNEPKGNTRVATYYAVGVQKYNAQPKPGSYPTSYEWVFVAPEADLFDATDGKVGSHFAGPSWEITPKIDLIIGQQFAPAKTVTKDPNSIDWLLLMPKTGTNPSGIFEGVAYIQRIATKGGKAPSTPPGNALETVEVPYTAVYRFTKPNR